MKKTLSTLLVGVGGYGAVYANYLLSGDFSDNYSLAGVVDPYAKISPHYEQLKEKVPIYDYMPDFFANHKADLSIIATPIQFHYDQCMAAFENGSHVLCEKPLVPTLDALDRLEAARGDKMLAVGFQWCYSSVMIGLKERILAGEFGKPVRLKSYVSWPRDWDYYNRGVKWAGKIKTSEGEIIHDSIASNATVHYIQNMLYLLGESMEESATLHDLQVECYRANDIESFDTIVMKGKAANAEVYYSASHATYFTIHPVMDYAFEKARIWLNVTNQDFDCALHHSDGRVEHLGDGRGDGERNRMPLIAKRLKGEQSYICSAQTARPITVFIDEIFKNVPFQNFPADLVMKDEKAKLTYVKNLHLDLWDCYNMNKLPSEVGLYA